MDKSDIATETLVDVKKEKTTSETEKKVEEKIVKEAPPTNVQYLSNFENLTVADIKREEEKLREEKAKREREALLEAELAEMQQEEKQDLQEEEKSAKSTNVIEKPNYDLIEENKKVVKLRRRTASNQKKTRKKKTAGLVLACALGASAIVCVTNTIILDQMNFHFVQLEDSYKLNLQKYLQDISNLDATKKGMEVIETYPEDLLEAGDVGEKSNWFDKICDFFGGLFGG